jgi:hypothetical protein
LRMAMAAVAAAAAVDCGGSSGGGGSSRVEFDGLKIRKSGRQKIRKRSKSRMDPI